MANLRLTRMLMLSAAAAALTACDTPFDPDLRDFGSGFDTSEAVANLPDRPRPDDRGIISYPTYQVAVAQEGDTVTSVAQRLGIAPAALASHNGLPVDAPLRRDELLALPTRVSEPSPATGAATTGPLDVAAIATTALDRAGTQAPVSTTALAPASGSAAPRGTEPLRHQVARGETIYTISRRYNVPVRNIADWNGIGADLAVREGQYLLIPQGNAPAPTPAATTVVEQPGAGSSTPIPPSAATALPDEAPEVTAPAATTASATPTPPADTPEAPEIGTATPAASDARLVYPVQGSIIRAYAAGRNEGIDIGVAPGTAVKAADAGEVAAVTTDTSGVAIVVIKHADNLLTVYTNLEGLSVAKGDQVTRGQQIARVRDADPSFLHFEVRRGLQSVDPADFLP